MHVGMCLPFQGIGEDGRTDRDVYRNELRLGDLAEPLGFESLWGVEHHFTDYTMSPDPIQYLSYFAARTEKIQLGTMVTVLPWHDPIRVAEEAALLDHLSGGRFVFGIGRGIGRVEFDGFRVDQNDSREMFVEYAETVLGALESGVCEFDGKFVKQPARDIRPRPFKSFRGRTYAAAVSPESAQIMAKLGIGLLMIPQKPWAQVVEELEAYRATYREVNGEEAPPPLMGGWICIHEDEETAREMAEKYLARYYQSVIDHYEFAGSHLQKMKGHETYAELQARMQADEGQKQMTDFFISLHPWGTPDMVYEKIVKISEMTGAEGFIGVFSSGGMDYADAEAGMRLFAEKVMPRLKKRIPPEKQWIARAGTGPAADPARFALQAAEQI